MQFRFACGHALSEQRRGKRDGVPFRIEQNRCAEELPVRLDVGWPAVGKHDLVGVPPGAAQLSHDVHGARHGGGADVVRSHGARLVDGVVEDREPAFDEHIGRGATQVMVEEAHQAVQRGAHVGRVPHEQSDQPERVQSTLLANQQPEVQASGDLCAAADQATSL